MNSALAHRGADADVTRTWNVGDGFVALGHRRLAIIDTSHNADQPLTTDDGRYTLIFNGAIYNYRELHRELGDDPIFSRSVGDTAVLLAALVRWGEAALPRLNGMWAFAFVDWKEQRLLLSRDRLGKKPLYYRQSGGSSGSENTLWVSSEVKGILAGTGQRFALNPRTLLRFLSQSITDDSDETFFDDILSVPAATFAWVDLKHPVAPLRFERYWRHPFELGVSPDRGALTPADVRGFRELLFDSVRLRLRSDVPVGILLSGGIDSNAIYAGIAASGQSDVRAFSVISDDPSHSEEPFIRDAARHFGIEPRFLNVDRDPMSLLDQLTEINWINDQPVPGMSNVAHFAMIRAAREEGVKVLLTGQGADEQLAGYNKFLYLHLLGLATGGHPLAALRLAAGFLANNTVFREFTLREASRYVPWLRNRGGARRFGAMLDHATPAGTGGFRLGLNAALYRDIAQFSLPQLLHTEDRMSMASGVEMHAPFLDYRIVELLARLPPDAKLAGGWTKAVLRQAVRGRVPHGINFRKDKNGFNIPEEAWFRGPLIPRLRKILGHDLALENLGVLRPGAGKEILSRWESGSRAVTYKELFTVVSLENWVRRVDSSVRHDARVMTGENVADVTDLVEDIVPDPAPLSQP